MTYPLNINNIVHVTIPTSIQGTNGAVLSEPYEFEFMTTTSPSYTKVRKIRLEIGGFISGIEDDTIQQAILEASLDADAITFQATRNTNFYNHARREYSTCLASKILLSNTTAKSMLKSKSLADLSVTYDPMALNEALNRLGDCIGRWEQQVIAGGYAKAIQSPRSVVKGEFDPDRPTVSRIWQSSDEGNLVSRRIPAANNRVRNAGHRRSLRTFWPRSR